MFLHFKPQHRPFADMPVYSPACFRQPGTYLSCRTGVRSTTLPCSFISISVTKYPGQKETIYLPFNSCHSPSWRDSKVGSQSRNLKAARLLFHRALVPQTNKLTSGPKKPVRSDARCCLLAGKRAYIQLASLYLQLCLGNDVTYRGLGPPISTNNQDNPPQTRL